MRMMNVSPSLKRLTIPKVVYTLIHSMNIYILLKLANQKLSCILRFGFLLQVWDDSWKYTPDNQPCMKIWFDGEKGNPNDNVTILKVKELMEWGKSGVKGRDNLPLNFILTAVVMAVFVQQKKYCSLSSV